MPTILSNSDLENEIAEKDRIEENLEKLEKRLNWLT
jgi:hypothetical protein